MSSKRSTGDVTQRDSSFLWASADLAYECALGAAQYMAGGDLRDALDKDKRTELVWYRKGYQIALDIARGLHFLHSHDVRRAATGIDDCAALLVGILHSSRPVNCLITAQPAPGLAFNPLLTVGEARKHGLEHAPHPLC